MMESCAAGDTAHNILSSRGTGQAATNSETLDKVDSLSLAFHEEKDCRINEGHA